MSEKGNVLLLILCGILCQGIIATSSHDDIREPSDLLAREKRVVDLDQVGHAPLPLTEAKYMSIIKDQKKATCVGVILSYYTVITAAMCVMENVSRYTVFAGSAYGHLGTSHNVSTKLVTEGNPPHEHFDGLALINVEPHFMFGPRLGSINLYTGPIRPGTLAAVNGWGCVYPPLTPPGIQRRLRQINIPIMDPSQCEHAYRGFFSISHKHICTSHSRKFCARTDIGAPLIINDMLAGIHVLKPRIDDHTNPEVFLNLQLPEYSVWLRQNIRFI